jgi:hypothetical protein
VNAAEEKVDEAKAALSQMNRKQRRRLVFGRGRVPIKRSPDARAFGRAFRGILPTQQRRALARVMLARHAAGDLPTYRGPQARRAARQARVETASA